MIDESFTFEFDIQEYPFNDNGLSTIRRINNQDNAKLWPAVYILTRDDVMEAYIGESTNIISRLGNHLGNPVKKRMNKIHLITSKSFNKSATLDIESNLIKYFSADKKYTLINGNAGLVDHNYYQKMLYGQIFIDIWGKLQVETITQQDLIQIDNSDYFKYSPYKSLTPEQQESVITILELLTSRKEQSIFIKGSAGTGKTIVAVYLVKLLLTDASVYDEESLDDNSRYLLELVNQYKTKYPDPKIALVVPMTSLRNTLKKVFRNIKGLSAKDVIGPSEIFKDNYDLVLVDESHRLRRRRAITNYKSFDDCNKALGFDETGTELDWILKKSSNQIFFYDPLQSIRPSDIPKADFKKLIDLKNSSIIELKSQLRVLGGADYIDFVERLLECGLERREYFPRNSLYEFYLFDDLAEMIEALRKKESKYGLCRLTAGFAWEWASRNKDVYDIIIGDVSLKWNKVTSNWINTENAPEEVGCIHTTQGYDLNYTGVIFGPEISYNADTDEIVIIKENYCDRNGKSGIDDPEELKEYVINIYKTLMYRGIKGTFVYVCDEGLRKYMVGHIVGYGDGV